MKNKHTNISNLILQHPIIKHKDWGLCINCANRGKCSYSNASGGVLYCNEYE